ncbi:MAG: hypothetical protein RI922_2940 [Bacteroidota bacterium]|jgi:hypothetical protein
MKKIIPTICVWFLVQGTYAQDTLRLEKRAPHTIYVEAFGQGLYDAISYDRLIVQGPKHVTSFSAGLTIVPTKDLFVAGLPLSYNWLLGKRNHFLELGLGLSAMYLVEGNVHFSTTTNDSNGNPITIERMGYIPHFYSYFTPKIGYRFQQKEGGLFLRATLTPAVAMVNYDGMLVEYGSQMKYNSFSGFSFFREAAFFPFRVFPWAGISVGYTFDN